MKNLRIVLCMFMLSVLPLSHSYAQESMSESDPDLLHVAIGYFDVFDDQESIDLRVEYRPAVPIFFDNLRPWAGGEITTEGTIWAGGGALYDWNFQDNWYATPSVGVGLYSDGGDDIDLDHPIQFRAQMEISYKFNNNMRLGAALGHMSNADLGDTNPGVETLDLGWSVPF